MDPEDIDVAVGRLVPTIRAAAGESARFDGVNSFHCFISYRVNADRVIAERIYEKLTLQGIFPFLDKVKLQPGYPWKEGFLQGLQNSKCYIPLISRRALEPLRDRSRDHSMDNLLLEIDTALRHRTATNNSYLITPILIGEVDGNGALNRFADFSVDLYAATVEGEAVRTLATTTEESNNEDEDDMGQELFNSVNPPQAEIVAIFETFTHAVNEILYEVVHDEAFDESDHIFITLGDVKLLYSKQVFRTAGWQTYWHILPIQAKMVHNLGGCKPDRNRFICKSKGTGSYCILRNQTDRDAVLQELHRTFLERGRRIIRCRRDF